LSGPGNAPRALPGILEDESKDDNDTVLPLRRRRELCAEAVSELQRRRIRRHDTRNQPDRACRAPAGPGIEPLASPSRPTSITSAVGNLLYVAGLYGLYHL
jgi:hypothetical protein